MHRLRSKSAIYRFRVAALLWYSKYILFPLCWVLLVYSIMLHDEMIIWGTVILSAFTAMIIPLQWIIASRTNCPLCITPVLANKSCAKNRHASTLLGSYRMRVATSILFRNSFRCPYCGEPTALELRQTHFNPANPQD